MKSLINYIKESFDKIKYVMKSPKEMLTIFADDINKAWDNPEYQDKSKAMNGIWCETDVLKNFWANFSHHNISLGKHFKILTPNINFKAGLQKNGFAKSLVDLVNSKIDTEGSARYLLCVYCDNMSYRILCIDLLEHEYVSVLDDSENLKVYARLFKEDDSIKDIGPEALITKYILKPSAKYMILTDEFYNKK